MLRRGAVTCVRGAVALRHASSGGGAATGAAVATSAAMPQQQQQLEQRAASFVMQPMADHPRSTFEYGSGDKGGEVGARNEAAFLNYTPARPHSLAQRLAMPGLVNLLTVTPLYCTLMCIASAAWGIFYWDVYCRKNYTTVLIARPADL